MTKVEELLKDIEELKKLHDEATRTNVKYILTVDIRKLETAVALAQSSTQQPNKSSSDSSQQQITRVYKEQIKKYAWDQSDKFFKLYVTLNDVQKLSPDDVTVEFTDQSVKMVVRGLNNREYELYIARLCEQIVPEDSYRKIKSDCILLMLKKKSTTTWAYVTESEKKVKESKKPAVDDKSDDPNASLMKMMQNMYEDGDDEMKKTIAKAWTENRTKEPMM